MEPADGSWKKGGSTREMLAENFYTFTQEHEHRKGECSSGRSLPSMALLSSVVDGFSLDLSNQAWVSFGRPRSLLSLVLLSPSEDSCCVDVLGELLEELGLHWMADEGVASV